MNHLLFDGIQAINQVGFLLCGLVLLGLGLAIIGHELYWRVHAQRVDGILAGVRTKNGFYYNVYHYVLPGTGDAIEATSTTGSNSLRGRTTGTPVRLMAMPSNPEHAEPAKSWIAFIAGNFLVMLGALFVWLPLRYFPVTRITWWMLAGFAVFATFRIKKLFRPPSSLSAQASGLGAAVSQWKADRITKRRAELQTLPVVPAEQIQPAPWAPRFAQHSSTNPKAAAAVMIVGGVVLLAIGSWMARNTIRLAHSGIRASGYVTTLEPVSGSEGGSTYRAVVQFTAANDREILFRDKISTSPALYHAGEPVMVLYLADDPLGSARIDRGIWKWLLPALLLTAGAGLLLCGKSISEIKENPETAQPTQS